MIANLPQNLTSLHEGEEFLRGRSIEAVQDARLRLHADITVPAA